MEMGEPEFGFKVVAPTWKKIAYFSSAVVIIGHLILLMCFLDLSRNAIIGMVKLSVAIPIVYVVFWFRIFRASGLILPDSGFIASTVVVPWSLLRQYSWNQHRNILTITAQKNRSTLGKISLRCQPSQHSIIVSLLESHLPDGKQDRSKMIFLKRTAKTNTLITLVLSVLILTCAFFGWNTLRAPNFHLSIFLLCAVGFIALLALLITNLRALLCLCDEGLVVGESIQFWFDIESYGWHDRRSGTLMLKYKAPTWRKQELKPRWFRYVVPINDMDRVDQLLEKSLPGKKIVQAP